MLILRSIYSMVMNQYIILTSRNTGMVWLPYHQTNVASAITNVYSNNISIFWLNSFIPKKRFNEFKIFPIFCDRFSSMSILPICLFERCDRQIHIVYHLILCFHFVLLF